MMTSPSSAKAATVTISSLNSRFHDVLSLMWICLCLFPLLHLMHTDAVSLAPIYWNSSNPMFKISKNDHIIDVKPFDDIDLVCPHYAAGQAPDGGSGSESSSADSHEEHYLIYRVSKSEYDDCNIYESDDGDVIGSQALLILNCSSPRQRRRFTILFEPFQSIPNVPEYKAGRSYYFISTSTGKRSGLDNQYQGACHFSNMKLTIRVCCETDSGAENDDYDVNGDNPSRLPTSVNHQPQQPASSNGRQQLPQPSDSAWSSVPGNVGGDRNVAAAPSSSTVGTQPGHRTAHRRKHPAVTSAGQASALTTTLPTKPIRHHHKHHENQRHQADHSSARWRFETSHPPSSSQEFSLHQNDLKSEQQLQSAAYLNSGGCSSISFRTHRTAIVILLFCSPLFRLLSYAM